MTLQRRLFCQSAALGLAGAALPSAFAAADPFPSKPIRIVVPYPAGGLTDTVARHAANGASPILKQPVVVENRPGVGGNLGAELVAKSPADGYNVAVMLSGSLATGAALYSKLKYDPGKDLKCVTELYLSNAVLAVSSDLPINNATELVAYAKANPGKLSIGSWGPGSAGHVTQHLLETRYGAKVLHVPYKGESQIVTDLIGGQVSMALLSAMIVQPQVKSGKLRPIAIMGSTRSAAFPDLPTLAEQGLKQEYWSMNGPTAVFAPQATPVEILQVLNAAFAQAAQAPKMQAFAKEVAINLAGNPMDQAQAHFEKYFEVIKRSSKETGVVLD
ncbi:hypothetical protein CCO03_02615 [Comamonas serinivorans]|uniref:ABC transporter substrate-binding protein n=1 Tax=Comamonas serinivorans TaxID=1082851 RepID=A0A1Y0EJB4_9BURK|nr:tripartite tricarboxylate transporter substrate binding protein [Comamonas serinivorans]ARU03723.1 hypothetical protein CCO03_02615 [Comamonas serinivorans]